MGGVCLSACWDTHPRAGTSPWAGTPLAGTPTPPRQVHPPGRYTPRAGTPWQVHPPGRYTPVGSYTPTTTVTAADGTHPTGMLTCILFYFLTKRGVPDGIPRNRFCQINGKKIPLPSPVLISTYVFFIKSLVFPDTCWDDLANARNK